MNKQEFLETLTKEQLNLLRDITDKDVMQELEKHNLKKNSYRSKGRRLFHLHKRLRWQIFN